MMHRNKAAILLAVAKFPVQLAQLFTSAKSFSANPLLGNRLLNRMGLHVFRVVLAAGISRFRFFCLQGLVCRQEREAYHRDGFLLIKNFLPPEQFAALNDEVRAIRGEVRECIQGDTLTHRLQLSERVLKQQPACRELLSGERLSKLMRYTASRNTSPVYYVQSIKSNVTDGDPDPQRNLHSDTFHATMKAWLFVDDVSDSNGPLNYVAGSQRLTLKRLLWEYRNSVVGSELENSYAARGSLRINKKELPAMGFPQPTAFRVPANTLVIANTNGFHCRGEATGGPSSRLEVWAYSRTNPFNPFPGVDHHWLRYARDIVIDKYLRREDKKAQNKDARASWHVVSPDAINETADSHRKTATAARFEEKDAANDSEKLAVEEVA